MGYLDRPQQVWWRKLLFQVHLWSGIGLGLYIFVVSVSGAALVFREEIQHLSEKRPVTELAGEPLGFDGIQAAVEEQFPGRRISWMRNRENPREAVEVWVESDILLFDAVSGELLGPKQESVGAVLQWLVDLHVNLLAGETGLLVNGVGAGFMVLMCVTGVVVWWPGIKNWRRGLWVDRKKKWKRFNWDLHSAVGFWTLAFVLIWGVTGVYFAFPAPFRALVGSFAEFQQFRARPEAEVPEGVAMLSAAALATAAEGATPGQVSTWIGFPRGEESALAQVYRKESFVEDAPLTGVIINAYSGEVLQVRPFDEPAPGDKVMRWFGYLHFGNFGGALVKVLWTVFGAAPALLFVTGSLMWWNRSLSKRFRKPKA